MARVLTLYKSLELLELVVQSDKGIGTRAIAQKLGENVATVHNIATTFMEKGYIRQDPVTRQFFPGMKLMRLSQHSSYYQFLSSAAQAIVHKVSIELNETVQLVANDQGRFVNLAFYSGQQSLSVNAPDQIREHNAHATAYGKTLLAYSDERVIHLYAEQGLQMQTPHTIGTTEALLAELDSVRNQGYARTEDEWIEGVSALAVPVRDAWGHVFAALGASAPTVRMKKPEQTQTVLNALLHAAKEIEEQWRQGVESLQDDTPPQNRRGRPRKL